MTSTTTVPATTYGWDALLADGGVVRIRPVTPADEDQLRALHRSASDRSIYLRYFSLSRLAGELYVDQVVRGDQDGIVLVAEEHGVVIGMAGCTRVDGTADGEVALLVSDGHQRRGVGTLLLEHLAAAARHAGIRSFVAETLTDNGLMHKVFTDAGFEVDRRTDLDVTDVRMSLAPTAAAQLAVDRRERAADAASLRHVLAPRSIAVVGASDRPGSVGGAVLRNIIAGHYAGILHPVNPNQQWVQRLRAYPSVRSLPEPVDLAVVAVPGPAVEQVIRDCGERGIPAAVILSAGFGEVGTGGADMERRLLRTAREAGVRLVGPNCLGIAAPVVGVRLNATFGATPPPPGVVGVASQSGALGIGLLAEAARRHIGVSGFVSLGNKLDVSGNDLLLYWEDDPATTVIALYLESFGNPGKFLRHARRIARSKPIVALKAGRTDAGARAGASHTAAAATPDVVVTTLLRQAGVIQVRSTEEMLDVTQLLSGQPVPAGTRLGILGNAGGPGILAADATADAGLDVPELSAATQDALRAAAPGLASALNPIDLGAAAGPEVYEQALRALLASGEVDAAVVIHAATSVSDPPSVASAIRRAARTAGARTTVAAVLIGTDADGALTDPTDMVHPLPPYAFPESAVRAIGHAAAYGAWLRRPAGTVRRLSGMDTVAARDVAVRTLAQHPDGRWLDPDDTADLLASIRVPYCRTEYAGSADDAVETAERLGLPVVLKTAATLAHKTELGGVRTDLPDPAAVRAAYQAITKVIPATGVLVQPMTGAGIELLVGISRTEPYPPVLLVGAGGTATALLGDTATRLAPITDTDAHDMIRELRSAPLLLGYRGAAAADLAAVEDLLQRIGTLADELPEIAELDLNPVIVHPHGLVTVDAKIRIAPVGADHDLMHDPMVRRLR
jgi:acyl-CoA synthetase (NDP forming)/GNAT superfamily N-acetyltransferase